MLMDRKNYCIVKYLEIFNLMKMSICLILNRSSNNNMYMFLSTFHLNEVNEFPLVSSYIQ